MKVTSVQISIPEFIKEDTEGRLKAFARVCLEDSIMIHGVRIVEGKEGLFVAMPNRKTSQGFKDVVHPITSELGETISVAVLEEFSSNQ